MRTWLDSHLHGSGHHQSFTACNKKDSQFLTSARQCHDLRVVYSSCSLYSYFIYRYLSLVFWRSSLRVPKDDAKTTVNEVSQSIRSAAPTAGASHVFTLILKCLQRRSYTG